MRNFEFYTPTKIYFGKDTHMQVGQIIKNYGFGKVLVHYGMGSIKTSGLYDSVILSLKENGINYVELGNVEPNPKLNMVREAVKICKEENVDMILAIGGGSVIDSAKLAACGAVVDFDPWLFSSKEKTPLNAIPVGVILTIASAGSEMSSSCVITNEDGNLKRGYNSDFNRPIFTIMNPELTFSVSKYQTACGVVDILMHTIERYFQSDKDCKLTNSIAEALMRNVIEAGEIVMQNPDDYEARALLMWASSLSHNDLTGAGKSPGLPVHQLEHEVSGMFDEVAHAAGLSVLFPAWADYVMEYDVLKFCQFATNVWGCNMDFENPAITAKEGIKRCKDYFANTLNMPISLAQLKIPRNSFEEMAIKCTFFGKRTIPGIKELGKQEILDIFEIAAK